MNLPITPQEAQLQSSTNIPSCVINATNKLIATKIGTSKLVKILQDDILEEAGAGKDNDAFRRLVFEEKWMDIEEIYRKVGWKVTYSKPAYCENYEAYFIFETP